MSAPGIGMLTAIRLALEWGDVSRFGRKEEFASFLGLVPSDYSSGEQERRGHITKQGNRSGEAVAGGVFVGSYPVRSGAAGEIPAGVEELWEQEESDRGGGEEAGIASSKGIVERRAVCRWGSGVTFLSIVSELRLRR